MKLLAESLQRSNIVFATFKPGEGISAPANKQSFSFLDILFWGLIVIIIVGTVWLFVAKNHRK